MNLVLKRVQEELEVLLLYRKALVKTPPEKPESVVPATANQPPKNPESVVPTTANQPHKTSESPAFLEASRYGYMLFLLSKSAALPMYLGFCQPPPKRVHWFKEKPIKALDEDEEREEGVELGNRPENDNKDFEFSTKPDEGKDTPVWQICLRWIKLLAMHFNAVSLLIGHIMQFPKISVHFLKNSPGQDSLLRWDTLLQNLKYFPEQTPGHNNPHRNEHIINKPYLPSLTNMDLIFRESEMNGTEFPERH